MTFLRLLEYTPIRQFVLKHKEKDGVTEAFVCERTRIRTEVANATRKEFNQLLPKIENGETAVPNSKFVVAREKVNNLATIYFLETENGPRVFDIHYHLNNSRNGFRTEEQVKADTLAILKTAGYAVELSVGTFICKQKRTGNKNTKQRRHVKEYRKTNEK